MTSNYESVRAQRPDLMIRALQRRLEIYELVLSQGYLSRQAMDYSQDRVEKEVDVHADGRISVQHRFLGVRTTSPFPIYLIKHPITMQTAFGAGHFSGARKALTRFEPNHGPEDMRWEFKLSPSGQTPRSWGLVRLPSGFTTLDPKHDYLSYTFGYDSSKPILDLDDWSYTGFSTVRELGELSILVRLPRGFSLAEAAVAVVPPQQPDHDIAGSLLYRHRPMNHEVTLTKAENGKEELRWELRKDALKLGFEYQLRFRVKPAGRARTPTKRSKVK